jgi:ferredoxin
MIAVNAKYSQKWPVITEMKDPPEDWKKWEHVEHKYPEHSSPNPGRQDDE